MTLFALIFAIGILVDDAIVVVENIHRHYQLGWTDPRHATVYGTDEVGNPTILATFAVVAALLPMAFVSGLMGPYMQPIPVNASAAMLFSLGVAFVVSPWVTYHLFRRRAQEMAKGPAEPDAETVEESRFHRHYVRLFQPLLDRAWARWVFLGGVGVLLLASMALIPARLVVVKMLPHDNKSEVQVIVDMPEGSTLEETAGVARALAEEVRRVPKGEWIRGGLTRPDWPNSKIPTRWQLDEIAPENAMCTAPHCSSVSSASTRRMRSSGASLIPWSCNISASS